MQELKQITALQAKVRHLKIKVKQQNATIRRWKQRANELQLSRTRWKHKRQQAAPCARPKPIAAARAQGYSYPVALIGLCVRLYLAVGCGYRGIVRMLLAWQLESGWGPERMPAKSSIALWVQKLGCYQYTHASPRTQPYALIVDECMVIGQQRLMVCLALDATKEQAQAITYQTVEVVHMQVRTSWKSEHIKTMLEAVSQKLGAKARYVISDGNANLRRGVREAGYERICDVSHQVALLVEHEYKKRAEFVGWQKALSMTKFKGIMQAHAYLLPPKQRSIARFMNLGPSLVWSRQVLDRFDQLSEREQSHLVWLKEYASFIAELGRVFGVVDQVVSTLKVEGLSDKTYQASVDLLAAGEGLIPVGLRDSLCAYLESEWRKLPNTATCWHCCSNVLESLFGHYKSALASDPLNGISGQVLSLPLRTGTGLAGPLGPALEAVSVADLAAWKRDNLPANLVVKRRKILKK